MSSDADASSASADSERQRVVRVRGSRRARLTPAPGTDPDPELAPTREDGDAPTGAVGASEASGPNDERMRRDVPPHY